MFPIINNVSNIAGIANGNFLAAEHDMGTICSYMYSTPEMFANPLECEFRGLTFDTKGNITSRPFHKFFNIGERPETQPDVIDWDSVVGVYNKFDGSMITFVLHNDELIGKTKKTFNSSEARRATEWLKQNPEFYEEVKWHCEEGYTIIFEWLDPTNPIVIQYPQTGLIPLAIRNNISGEYLSHVNHYIFKSTINYDLDSVRNLINDFKVNGKVSWDKFKEAIQTETQIEGWIIVMEDGSRYKVKTKWYMDLHHKTTFVTTTDIKNATLDETYDDLYSSFVQLGRSEVFLSTVREINQRVNNQLEVLKNIIDVLIKLDVDLSIADFAKKHVTNEIFPLLMKVKRGKEISQEEFAKFYDKCKMFNYPREVIQMGE